MEKPLFDIIINIFEQNLLFIVCFMFKSKLTKSRLSLYLQLLTVTSWLQIGAEQY